jgi:hypothetical protein
MHNFHTVKCLSGMPMPHVEIWKSKPSWHSAAREERSGIIQRLNGLVHENADQIETCGPYLLPDSRGYTLIWHVETERAQQVKALFEKLLASYFEPLMFGSAGQLTAKDYYERMSGMN